MKIQHAKEILLGDDKIRKSFEKNDLDSIKINVGLQILELRLIKNLTQKQLAKKIGTKQPSIARVERGATAPSLTFLYKIASAVGTDLIPPKFAIVEENELRDQLNSLVVESVFRIAEHKTEPTDNYRVSQESRNIIGSSTSPLVNANKFI